MTADNVSIPAGKDRRLASPIRRVFFPSAYLLMALFVLVGFAPAFYLRRPELGPMPLPLVAHGLLMTAWMLTALVQSALPTLGRIRLHRALGWSGVLLAAVVWISGVLLVAYSVRTGRNPNPAFLPTPEAFAIVPVRDLLLFGPMVLIAVLLRNSGPAAHKRLMLIAALSLMSAPLSRIPLPPPPAAFFLGTLGVLIALAVYDLTSLKRLHPATLWGGVATVTSIGATPIIGRSPGWQTLVAALT